jgi:hypothetical protein
MGPGIFTKYAKPILIGCAVLVAVILIGAVLL